MQKRGKGRRTSTDRSMQLQETYDNIRVLLLVYIRAFKIAFKIASYNIIRTTTVKTIITFF